MEVAKNAQLAARQLAGLPVAARNHMLACVRDALAAAQDKIVAANEEDVKDAHSSTEAQALIKRLKLNDEKFAGLLEGLDQVIAIEDPLGRTTLKTEVSEGLVLERITCPIGVLCIIYEARPEAGVQIASLAIKSGNALILKGGKEASKSNHAIYEAIVEGLKMAKGSFEDVPVNAVQLVDTRDEIAGLLALEQYIDLVIPRGSNALVKNVKDNTKIPVLGHADGICNIYVDENFGDIDRAARIIVDAKTGYPAGCNAMECLLVHSSVLEKVLPAIGEATKFAEVKFRADERAIKFLPADRTVAAVEADFGHEYLAYEMSVKTVDNLREAIEFINSHSSRHTEAIITEDKENARVFQTNIDSSSVYVNCSTRFADGFRYGFGAEVGISTSKIHSRGPVGVEGLVIYKYLMTGNGHCVGEMSKSRVYTHKNLL